MRKSNNYYKFMEYVSCGQAHENTVCKDNGVLECTSYVTCADVPGYMNDGCSTVHAYNGKYGKGVLRTRQSFYKGRRSTNYMTIEYWVSRDDIHKRLTGESEV